MSGPALAAGGRRSPVAAIDAGLRAVNERPRFWLTLFSLLLAAQIRPWWLPQADGRSFLSMARSLAVEGHMRNMGRPTLWYFPGYSLLLSPLYLFGDRPFWLLSAFQWVSAILFMLGVYWWARSVAPKWAVWIAAISVMNEGVWIHCARTMSEVPFMCGLIWSANAALAAGRSRSWGRMIALGALAAALLAVTSLVRPAGILLAAGFALYLGSKALCKETTWRRAAALALIFGVPSALCIAGFLERERAAAANGHTRTYLNNFSDSAASPLTAYGEGVRLAIRDSGRVFIPGMFKSYQERGWRDLNLLVYLPACALLATGWWRLVRRTNDPLLWMTPFYVLLYIVYPYEAGARFYVPLIPVFAVSLVRVVLKLPAHRHLIVSALLGAHLALAASYCLLADAARGRAATARWSEIDAIAQSINFRQDHVVAWNVPGEDLFMLELAIDRPIRREGPETIAAETEWVVAGRNAPAVPPFETYAQTDSLRLLRRRERFERLAN